MSLYRIRMFVSGALTMLAAVIIFGGLTAPAAKPLTIISAAIIVVLILITAFQFYPGTWEDIKMELGLIEAEDEPDEDDEQPSAW